MDSIRSMTTYEHRWCLVLVRTMGPINLGMCMRLAANLGVDDVRLVQPLCQIDCDDSRKFANHARHRLPELPVYDDVASAIQDCDLVIGTSARERAGERGRPRTVDELPDLVQDHGSRRTALVFGNEQHGLHDAELAHCQAFLTLATPGDYPSYNLSHAVAIILYAAIDAEPRILHQQPRAADQMDRERLQDYWMRTLIRFRYFRRTDPERFEPQLRAFLNRMPLQRADCELLRGMLAQFNYLHFGDKEPPQAGG